MGSAGPDPLKGLDETLAPGTVLGGRYRIDRRIGRGGMGTVYAATHLQLRRGVALKVIARQHTADPRQVARFRREARVASQLKHKNVVEVLDLAQADGREYIAMELLEGVDLCDAIQLAGSYAPADAVPVLDQVLAALDAAHSAGLVHRDLKPENIYLSQSPSGEITVKLLDFGVVKVMEEGGQAQLTRTGTVVGTPEYMAPEQATGGTVDARADLYALGCISQAMFCGKPPFVGKSILLVMAAQVSQAPPLPSQVKPDLEGAAAIDAFIARALAKKPSDRYPSAAVMRDALGTLAQAVGAHDFAHRKITLPSSRYSSADVLAAVAARHAAAPVAPAAQSDQDGQSFERMQTTTDAIRSPPPARTTLIGLAVAAAAGAALAVGVTYYLMR